MGHALDGQPGGVGGEAARGQVVEPHAVLQVADDVLDLGVASMVGLQFPGVAVSIGDESVIAVGGEQGQLGAWCGFHPPDDEPHRHGVGLAREGDIRGFGHVGGTFHPVRDGRPVCLRYGLDDVAHALVLADGDRVADTLIATGGDNVVVVEAAVGPHGELTGGTGVAHPTHRLPQEVGGTPCRVGAALAQPCHQHVAGSGGHGQQRVIAPLAGVAVMARAFLAHPVGLADG